MNILPAHLLEIENLSVSFGKDGGEVKAVQGINFNVKKGEIVALVGESGSGNSVTALSVMQLLPYPRAHHPQGSIKFNGQELIGAKEDILQKIRGDRIGIIFQEPMTSLNPLHTLEKQIAETLFVHGKLDKASARQKVLALLDQVGLSDAENRLQSYPHQLS